MSQIQIIHAGLTDIGNVRKANEDHYGFSETVYGPLFTVCDGMGGHVGGATAAQLAVKSINDFIVSYTDGNASVAIHNAILFANEQIIETAKQNPGLRGMGTTATVLLVRPDGVYTGHIGDSRIYLFSDGRLHRLTRDHSFVQTLIDSGAITDEEAESHPRRNEIMRALGVTEAAQPTVISKPVQPKAGDVFMLCTDGLCGLVTDTQMEKLLLGQVGNPEAACQSLISAAKAAGGHDNITAQLVRVTESPYRVSSFDDLSPKKKPDLATTDVIETPVTPQSTPVQKKEVNKVSPKLMVIVSIAVALLTAVGITYFAGIWPFNAGKTTTAITTPPTPDTKPTITTAPTVVSNGLLPGDSINGNYLIHTIHPGESLQKIINDRKNTDNPAYRQYDYTKTFSAVDEKEITKNDLKGYTTIKWERHEEAEKTGLDIVTPGPPPVKVEPKQAAPVVKKPAEAVAKTGDAKELKKQLDKAKEKMEAADKALKTLQDKEAAAINTLEKVKEDAAKSIKAAKDLDKIKTKVATAVRASADAKKKYDELAEKIKTAIDKPGTPPQQ